MYTFSYLCKRKLNCQSPWARYDDHYLSKVCWVSQHVDVQQLGQVSAPVGVVLVPERVTDGRTFLLHDGPLIGCCTSWSYLSNQIPQPLGRRHGQWSSMWTDKINTGFFSSRLLLECSGIISIIHVYLGLETSVNKSCITYEITMKKCNYRMDNG